MTVNVLGRSVHLSSIVKARVPLIKPHLKKIRSTTRSPSVLSALDAIDIEIDLLLGDAKEDADSRPPIDPTPNPRDD